MKYLSEFDNSRQNNFTLIRLILAWLVLYGHSFEFQKYYGLRDPLNNIFQKSTWIGEIAVNLFFVISGYFIVASFVNRGIFKYLVSRILRIYPALIFCVFIIVFLLGPSLTNLSLSQYFNDGSTFDYLFNSIGYFRMRHFLPGVFEENYNKGVNGSLWTLTVEIRCYIIVAILGLLSAFKNRLLFNVLCVFILLFAYYNWSQFPLLGKAPMWSIPSLYFLIGATFYINRHHIPLSGGLALFSAIVILISFGKPYYNYTTCLPFSYIVFFLAYSTKFIDIDNMFGDLSYGVYIYAFPIQQIVASKLPTITPYLNVLICTPIVFFLALLSWKLLEKPSLSLKRKLIVKK